MQSKYEKKVESLLIGKCIYKKEVIMPYLYGYKNTPLRFDFGIYYPNKQLKCLIEVDGEFHFHQSMGKLKYIKQKGYDEKKNVYCLARNILLIRIPYWEIQDLTYDKIFNTPYFVVKNKLHNSFLTPPK